MEVQNTTEVKIDGTTIRENGKIASYKLDGLKVTDGTNTIETKADAF